MDPALQLFPVEFLAALADAAAAIARAEERLVAFPEPAVLTARIRMAEREALAWLEGEPFDPRQLERDYGTSPRAWRYWPFTFIRVFDRPIASKTVPSAARIERWINPVDAAAAPTPAPADHPLELYPQRLERFAHSIGDVGALPRLVAGAHIAAEFAAHHPLVLGNTVVGAMLGEQYALAGSRLSAGGIAALGLLRANIPWRRHVAVDLAEIEVDLCGTSRDTRIQLAWLRGLRAGAEAALQLASRCRLWLDRVHQVSAGLRRTSRLRDVCLHAALSPSLTVATASKALRISRQAATDLVGRACQFGLLREVTEAGSFRRYVSSI